MPPSTSYGWSENINSRPTTSRRTATANTSTHSSRSSTPDYSQRTVVPNRSFDIERDVLKVRCALESCDKDALINVLCQRSTEQRHKIAALFGRIYGVRLPRCIKDSISTTSDFSVLMCGLVMPLYEFMARAIHNSVSYQWLCFIMFVIPNDERANMKNYFELSKLFF